jgi:peptidoglycan/LPS O-acetylase OafA/YrhL
MQYRPEIDGLRAVAVIPVVLFHANVYGFAGGFLGVDVFFVISGFLITSIIIADLEKGRFSIAKFYERRARRILPALTVMMAVCTLFAWKWMLPSEITEFGKALAATALFVSNVLFWRETNYFSADAALNPLLHTWSLAVEEQFYILFPLVLFAMWSRLRRGVMPLFVIGIAASLTLTVWAAENAPIASFFLAPTRAFELLIGSCAAWFAHKRAPMKSEAASIAGLCMVMGAIVFLADETATPGFWSLIPVLGTAMILLFARDGTLVAALLGWRPIVGIGLISYSVYLWHQPILSFSHIRLARPADGLTLWVLLVATFAVGWMSWAWIEQPFRKHSVSLRGTWNVIYASAALILVTASIGGVILSGNGFEWRKTPSGSRFTDLLSLESAIAPNYGLSKTCEDIKNFDSMECKSSNGFTAALWGDSFAMHLVPAIQVSATELHFAQLTLSQCAPIPGLAATHSITLWQTCMAFNDAAESWIISQDNISLVVLSTPLRDSTTVVHLRDGSTIDEPAAIQEAIRNSLVDLAQRLGVAGKRLVLVGPPPHSGENLGICFLRRQVMGLPADACDFTLDEADIFDKPANDQLEILAGQLNIVTLEDMICSRGSCSSNADETSLYNDRFHLSIEGSSWLGRTFDLAGKIIGSDKVLPNYALGTSAAQ